MKTIAKQPAGRVALNDYIATDPEILGGTPVFAGTRVPVQNLIDYLEDGESIGEFLEGFPTVKREQVIAFLELIRIPALVDGGP